MYAARERANKVGEDAGINGVDQSADSAVVVRSRFKAKPLERWAVWRIFPSPVGVHADLEHQQDDVDYRRNVVAARDFGKQSCGHEDDGKGGKKRCSSVADFAAWRGRSRAEACRIVLCAGAVLRECSGRAPGRAHTAMTALGGETG